MERQAFDEVLAEAVVVAELVGVLVLLLQVGVEQRNTANQMWR